MCIVVIFSNSKVLNRSFDSSLLMLSNKFLVSHLIPLEVKVISCFMSAKTLFFIVKLHLWMFNVSLYFYILPKMSGASKGKISFPELWYIFYNMLWRYLEFISEFSWHEFIPPILMHWMNRICTIKQTYNDYSKHHKSNLSFVNPCHNFLCL